jgi:hypothetical protein
MANEVPHEARIGVRAVLTCGDATLGEIVAQSAARDAEEWPEQVGRARNDPPEAMDAAPGEEAEEKCLDLIVTLVGGDNEVRPTELANAAENAIARFPGRRFDAARAYGLRIERPVDHIQRNLETRAEFANESFVVIGLVAAEVVIDVRRREFEAPREVVKD